MSTFKKVTDQPVSKAVVLVKGTATDSFTVLGGPTNVLSVEEAAAAAAATMGPPNNSYEAVVAPTVGDHYVSV